VPVYGGTGDPSQYPQGPTPAGYQNWNNLASSWAPGGQGGDMYSPDQGYLDEMGGDYYDTGPYFDPNE
jgi:hypothetical protein